MTRRSLLLIAAIAGRTPKGISMTTQPYTLEADIRPRQFHVGAPVEVNLALVNRSNVTIQIGQRSIVFDWHYDLTHEDGSQVPMTRYGEEGRRSIESGPPGAVLRTLAPGERLTAAIPLHEIFILDQPGKYRLVVSRSLPDPQTRAWIEVRSAPVEFAIRA
jgi:hypothetical protein